MSPCGRCQPRPAPNESAGGRGCAAQSRQEPRQGEARWGQASIPVSSGLSQAACSPPAPHFHAGNQKRSIPAPRGTLPVLLLAAAPGTWGGDDGGHQPLQPSISPVRQQLCHQTAVRKFMLSNFLQLGGRQEAQCRARHRVLFVCPQVWLRLGSGGDRGDRVPSLRVSCGRDALGASFSGWGQACFLP